MTLKSASRFWGDKMKVMNASGGSIFKAVIGLALSAAPALAETCDFTQECFEAEACSETSFSMEIDGDQLIMDAETIMVSTSGFETARISVGSSSSAVHVLTRQTGGEARYSTHIFDGPLMVSYLGSCS